MFITLTVFIFTFLWVRKALFPEVIYSTPKGPMPEAPD